MNTLNEWDSKQRLGAALPRPEEIRSRTRAEAEAFAAALGGRVVAKASGIAHKTEGGLVRTGLAPEEVGAVWQALADAGDGTVIIARQLEAELELIVGGYRDPAFGPVVTVGIGGVAAEIFGDVAAMLAPPEPGEVRTAVEELAGKRLLAGFRGRPPVDLVALEDIVGRVAHALVTDPEIAEIDCNPVMVCDGRPLVADALVVHTGRGHDLDQKPGSGR